LIGSNFADQRLSSVSHLQLWAKTNAGGIGPHYHPLGYHLLDVAAAADRLIARDEVRFARLAGKLGAGAEVLRRLTLFLIALHDIGKASRAFQAKAESFWCADLLGPFAPPVPEPHGKITGWYLGGARGDAPLSARLEALLAEWESEHRAWLIEAIAGHHGRPVAGSAITNTGVVVGRGVLPVARALVDELRSVLGAEPVSGREIDEAAARAFAWYIATLLPLADWLGSSMPWFEPHAPTLSLDAYWEEVAQPRAGIAIQESGLAHVAVSRPDAAASVLPGGAAPSPVQHWAASVALPQTGPFFAAIEDATGSGKTEAALLLAHRLMHEGGAAGFYIALPTMATANAMFARLEPVHMNLFAPGARPSLMLAHGHARRDPAFSRLREGRPEREPRGQGDDLPVSAYCAGWIADDRRLAFLAQAGAGTIDQALLAVLPSKYQTLRLRGLADKVLIVDEAHAYDAYMAEELEALLRFHAAQGGSAIVLSATLPAATRGRLFGAFADGAGWEVPRVEASAYPLAGTLHAGGLRETALTSRAGTERQVRVERLEDIAAGEAMALARAGQGAAVALIRSTVDAAIESFERLRAEAGENITVLLFHARFLFADRMRIEEDVLRRFGKLGRGRERCILVATQVIEQSLDIDFDAMVSDLAPIDLLIQRAGRLWRHEARHATRPVAAPVLHVVSPEPTAEADDRWLDATLPEAKWVYRDPALLWASAKALLDARAIVSGTLNEDGDDPRHVRRLVERVYGTEFGDLLPAGLHASAETAQGESFGARALARNFVLSPHRPYAWEGPWADDAQVATRLEDESHTLRLARREEHRLVPLASGPQGESDWTMSELRVRKRLARDLRPPGADDHRRLDPPWAEADTSVLLLEMDAREGRFSACSSDQAKVLLYDAHTGLRLCTSK
jgi:CRISPR-associated endonuclease/helicase Cas3